MNTNEKVTSTINAAGQKEFWYRGNRVICTGNVDLSVEEVEALFTGQPAPTQETAQASNSVPSFNDPTARYQKYNNPETTGLRPIGTLIDANYQDPMAGDRVKLPAFNNGFMNFPECTADIEEVRTVNGQKYFTTLQHEGAVYPWPLVSVDAVAENFDEDNFDEDQDFE